jgi:hypothetical protein
MINIQKLFYIFLIGIYDMRFIVESSQLKQKQLLIWQESTNQRGRHLLLASSWLSPRIILFNNRPCLKII